MKSIICILFIGLSCAVYAEDNTLVVPGAGQPSEDVVMTFMRKSQVLPAILSLINRRAEEDGVLRNLPFYGLDRRLLRESQDLIVEEGKRMRESEVDQAKLKAMLDEDLKAAEASGNLENLFVKVREIGKEMNTPALVEMMGLQLALSHDIISIYKSLLETEDINLGMSERDLAALIASKMTPDEFKGLVEEIFNFELAEYNDFVEQNKDVLEKVTALANNGFKMETKSEKCRIFKGKKLCVPTSSSGQIKSLSEIMPYVLSVKSNEAIADKKEL